MKPTAAQALFPHLPKSKPDEPQMRVASNKYADAIYPNLSLKVRAQAETKTRRLRETKQHLREALGRR